MLNIPIEKGKRMEGQFICIHGPEGIGKSTLAAGAPSPLFLDTEHGTRHLNVHRVDIEVLDHIIMSLSALLNEVHEYKTVVIDTCDNMKRLAEAYVIAENNWKSLETPSYGKGYRLAYDRFKIIVDIVGQLLKKGIHVIAICHSKVLKINPPDTAEYSKYCLKVSDTNKENDESRVLIKDQADCILFCNFETVVNSSTGKASKHERVIYTQAAPTWEAKNRYRLPEKLPLTPDAMKTIFEYIEKFFEEQETPTPTAKEVQEAPQEAQVTEEDELVYYFTGTGKLQPGQSLSDLPEKIAAALKARPEQALTAARKWNAEHRNELVLFKKHRKDEQA